MTSGCGRRSTSQTSFCFVWGFGQMLSFSFSFSFSFSSASPAGRVFVKPGSSKFKAVPNTPQAYRSDWPGGSTGRVGGEGQGRAAMPNLALRTSKAWEDPARVSRGFACMQRQISGDVGRSGDACSCLNSSEMGWSRLDALEQQGSSWW
jgi:hypothetical protein